MTTSQTDIILNARDVTERRHLEERLQQAGKLEAVGQLAGQVAGEAAVDSADLRTQPHAAGAEVPQVALRDTIAPTITTHTLVIRCSAQITPPVMLKSAPMVRTASGRRALISTA